MKILMLISLFLFNPLTVYANTDDCKTDVYFANGIKTEIDDAEKYSKLLRTEIINMLGESYTQQIGKVSYVYNNTHGFFLDGLETFLQKFGWQTTLDKLIETSHKTDLDEQVKAYQTSINEGHKVLAVAHSQGNLFTYEAYNALGSSMQEDFEAVSIASPMKADIKSNTTRIDLDNDIVPRIARLGASSSADLENNVRVINWDAQGDYSNAEDLNIVPDFQYIYKSNIGEIYSSGEEEYHYF